MGRRINMDGQEEQDRDLKSLTAYPDYPVHPCEFL
jgi:hypothetical protein